MTKSNIIKNAGRIGDNIKKHIIQSPPPTIPVTQQLNASGVSSSIKGIQKTIGSYLLPTGLPKGSLLVANKQREQERRKGRNKARGID